MIIELCRRAMKEHGIPGLSIGIIRNGRPWLVEGLGRQRLGERRMVDGGTLFHMASITKMFTGTAIMQLVEEDRVGLEDKVLKIIPRFRLNDPRFRRITLRHLLKHTSGLPDVTDFGWDRPEYDDGALMRHIDGMSALRLQSEPGKKYSYSDLGFEVLGGVIAAVSGLAYEEYLRRHVLAPAGMTESTFLLTEVDHRHLARPHVRDATGKIRPSEIFPYNRRHAPSSTLYSSASDMVKWMKVLVEKGKGLQGRILPRSAYGDMWRRSNLTHGVFWLEVGMGFFAGRYKRMRFVGHEGSDRGFRSSMVVFPRSGLGISIAVNHDGEHLKGLMESIFEILPA